MARLVIHRSKKKKILALEKLGTVGGVHTPIWLDPSVTSYCRTPLCQHRWCGSGVCAGGAYTPHLEVLLFAPDPSQRCFCMSPAWISGRYFWSGAHTFPNSWPRQVTPSRPYISISFTSLFFGARFYSRLGRIKFAWPNSRSLCWPDPSTRPFPVASPCICDSNPIFGTHTGIRVGCRGGGGLDVTLLCLGPWNWARKFFENAKDVGLGLSFREMWIKQCRKSPSSN